MIAWTSGPCAETLAETVVATTRRRTKGHAGIPFISDGITTDRAGRLIPADSVSVHTQTDNSFCWNNSSTIRR